MAFNAKQKKKQKSQHGGHAGFFNILKSDDAKGSEKEVMHAEMIHDAEVYSVEGLGIIGLILGVFLLFFRKSR